MTDSERFAAAINAYDPPVSLRAVVAELAVEGRTNSEIYNLLEKLLFELRARECLRECDEDVVLDAMDAMSEWCHPSARMLPEQNVN